MNKKMTFPVILLSLIYLMILSPAVLAGDYPWFNYSTTMLYSLKYNFTVTNQSKFPVTVKIIPPTRDDHKVLVQPGESNKMLYSKGVNIKGTEIVGENVGLEATKNFFEKFRYDTLGIISYTTGTGPPETLSGLSFTPGKSGKVGEIEWKITSRNSRYSNDINQILDVELILK